MNITSFIVEDISAASDTLEVLLEEFDEIYNLGTANNADDAIKKIKRIKPDLLFMDVKLGKATAFDILDACTGHYKYIVFTTAHDEFAIQSFNYNTVLYVLKPVDIKSIELALKKIKNNLKHNSLPFVVSELQELKEEVQHMITDSKFIFLFDDQMWQKIEVSTIIYAQAYSSYTKIHTTGKALIATGNLKQFTLKQHHRHIFFRIGKSHTINVNHIKCIQKGKQSLVEMSNGTVLPLSPLEKLELFKMLEI